MHSYSIISDRYQIIIFKFKYVLLIYSDNSDFNGSLGMVFTHHQPALRVGSRVLGLEPGLMAPVTLGLSETVTQEDPKFKSND